MQTSIDEEDVLLMVQGSKKKNTTKGDKKKKKKKKQQKKKDKLKKLRAKICKTTPVAVIGLGVVGSAVADGFRKKGLETFGYDKYKNGGIGSLEECLGAKLIFLCLPTLYSEEKGEYDKSSIEDVALGLTHAKYEGLVVLKSTVEPGTTSRFADLYPTLKWAHNPEFLSARTAAKDFWEQSHIVCGKGPFVEDALFQLLPRMYSALWPKATISRCLSDESECMKSFVNNFYAYKIMAFNEFFMYCESAKINFPVVTSMMIRNGWINPMHTLVPGTDGKLGFGGMCFPKDTAALLGVLKRQGTPHRVLEAVVEQNKEIRD